MYQFYWAKARVATHQRENTNEKKLRRVVVYTDVWWIVLEVTNNE
jgi:hypothetical protein